MVAGKLTVFLLGCPQGLISSQNHTNTEALWCFACPFRYNARVLDCLFTCSAIMALVAAVVTIICSGYPGEFSEVLSRQSHFLDAVGRSHDQD